MHSALVSRVRARRVLTILCFALVALFWGVLAVPAIAVPSGISFSRITPIDGTTLLVARTAADNPLDPPTFQLKADIYINNAGGSDQEVASVEFSYPGSGISDRTYTPMSFTDGVGSNFVMPAGDEGRVPVYDGLGRDLPTPLPSTVRIEVLFDGDPDPLVLQFSLAFRDNPIPLGAYFFPARAADLDAGQFWIFRTRHTVDAGGGGGTLNPSTRSQRYGLDMGVARYGFRLHQVDSYLDGGSVRLRRDLRETARPAFYGLPRLHRHGVRRPAWTSSRRTGSSPSMSPRWRSAASYSGRPSSSRSP